MLLPCDCVATKYCPKLKVLDYKKSVDISLTVGKETFGVYLEEKKIKKLIKYLEKIIK